MSNPLLDDLKQKNMLDTVEIALPTGGMFYDVDNPDLEEDERILPSGTNPEAISVHPISIMAEQSYRDPLLLASGRGLPQMLKHVCPSIRYPDELTEIDIDLILLTTRMLSYGNDMVLDHVCDNEECKAENNIDVDLQIHILRYDPAELGLLEVHDDFGVPEEFIIDIPETDQTVVLRLLPYADTSSAIIKSFEIQQKYEEIDASNTGEHILSKKVMEKYNNIVDISVESGIETLVANIYYIQTSTGVKVRDMDQIKDWILHVNTKIIERVQKRIKSISERLREISLIKYDCPECEHKNELYLHLDPQRLFSSAEGSQTAPKKRSAPLKSSGTKKTKPSRISQR